MNEEIIVIPLTLNHQHHTVITHHLLKRWVHWGWEGGGVVGGVPNE